MNPSISVHYYIISYLIWSTSILSILSDCLTKLTELSHSETEFEKRNKKFIDVINYIKITHRFLQMLGKQQKYWFMFVDCWHAGMHGGELLLVADCYKSWCRAMMQINFCFHLQKILSDDFLSICETIAQR